MAKFHKEMPERTFRMLSANHPDWSFMLCRCSHSMSLASGLFWIWVVLHWHARHEDACNIHLLHFNPFNPLPISFLIKRRYQDSSGRLLSRCLAFFSAYHGKSNPAWELEIRFQWRCIDYRWTASSRLGWYSIVLTQSKVYPCSIGSDLFQGPLQWNATLLEPGAQSVWFHISTSWTHRYIGGTLNNEFTLSKSFIMPGQYTHCTTDINSDLVPSGTKILLGTTMVICWPCTKPLILPPPNT